MIQWQIENSYQISECAASGVQSFVIDVEFFSDIHILQSCSDFFHCMVLLSVIQLYFYQTVYKQGSIADKKVCFDPFGIVMEYRSCVKACLHDPETVFDLISLPENR